MFPCWLVHSYFAQKEDKSIKEKTRGLKEILNNACMSRPEIFFVPYVFCHSCFLFWYMQKFDEKSF